MTEIINNGIAIFFILLVLSFNIWVLVQYLKQNFHKVECIECKTKMVKKYYRNKNMLDTHLFFCKKCINQKIRENKLSGD